MGQKQKTEYIKNKEHEIEASKLQNAKMRKFKRGKIFNE